MQHALYLFCLARAGALPVLHLDGLDADRPVFAEECDGVAALVCEVPLHEFSGPTAEALMQDLTWVGPKALRHGQVIEEIMRFSPVIPARFGTLFSSVQSLNLLLKRNLERIRDFLDQAADRDEWGVKGLVSKALVKESLVAQKLAANANALAEMSPGVRYFKERQIRAEVEKETGAWLKRTLRAVFEELGSLSAGFKKRDVLIRSTEGSDRETVANWAFFVERRDAGGFKEIIRRKNAENEATGLVFQVSGPWPPYSFSPALEIESGS